MSENGKTKVDVSCWVYLYTFNSSRNCLNSNLSTNNTDDTTQDSTSDDSTTGGSKHRIRIYNYSDQIIKFERKTKLNQYVSKDCVKISREDADKIIAGDVDFLVDSENEFLKEFYLKCHSSLLKPIVIVDYFREAYIHPVGNVRITFDTEIKTDLGPADFFNSNCHTAGVN